VRYGKNRCRCNFNHKASNMGSRELIKLLHHFRIDQVYYFWLIQPKVILISCNSAILRSSGTRAAISHRPFRTSLIRPYRRYAARNRNAVPDCFMLALKSRNQDRLCPIPMRRRQSHVQPHVPGKCSTPGRHHRQAMPWSSTFLHKAAACPRPDGCGHIS